MENNELNGKELNQEDLEKAAGGKGPDMTEKLPNKGYCIKHGHEPQLYDKKVLHDKELMVGKYLCRMCGKRGYFKTDLYDGDYIYISEGEYNALINS